MKEIDHKAKTLNIDVNSFYVVEYYLQGWLRIARISYSKSMNNWFVTTSDVWGNTISFEVF